MITIPDSIKRLLKQDNVLKNFRVTFPNGDREDIVNDQLIKESMKFDESLVSRVPVKFGLCEANVITFQCVGIENIKRRIIHVQMEIDISSLSAEEQAQYGQTSADVPFPYYVLHYGSFIVTSCERDSALNLRKIIGTSYGLSGSGEYVIQMDGLCEYDRRKMFYYTYSASKTALFWNNASYVILQGQDMFDPDITGGVNADVATTPYYEFSDRRTVRFYNKSTGNEDTIEIIYDLTYNIETLQAASNIVFEACNIAYFKAPDYYMEDAAYEERSFINFFESKYDVEKTYDSRRSWKRLKERIHNIYSCIFFIQWYYAANNKTNPAFQNTDDDYVLADSYRFAPLNSYVMSNGETVALPLMMHVRVESPAGNADFNTDIWEPDGLIKKYFYEPLTIEILSSHSYPSTIVTQQVKIDTSTRYSPAVPISDIIVKTSMQDMLELQGKFGGLGRDGTFREYKLLDGTFLFPSEEIYPSDTLYPCSEVNSANIGTGEFITAKWDEGVFYYKGIYAAYKDSDGNDAEYRVLFDPEDDNPDMPYYNISSNSIISGGRYTESALTDLITGLVAMLRKFRYYTSDITMRALPNIEIGDTLFLRAQHDTIVTPVLTQTITGIQDLRAKIVSR